MRRLTARLIRAQDGAAVVEFALVAPVFLMALLGIFDLSYNIYTSAMLEGSIQKAARDATIEGATATVDNRVRDAVHAIMPDAAVSFSRQSYSDYAHVANPEDFTDISGNGLCDGGEPFEDINGNNHWDADPATSGSGGARDAVLYTVTVSYNRVFPIHGLIPGYPSQVTTVARTILRNQPYGEQATTVTVGTC